MCQPLPCPTTCHSPFFVASYWCQMTYLGHGPLLLAELTRLSALVASAAAGIDFCKALPLLALVTASPLPPATRRCLLFLPLLLAVPFVAAINPCSNNYSRWPQPLPSPSYTIFPIAVASSPSSPRNRSLPPQQRRCRQGGDLLAGNNIDNKKERKRLEQEAATMVVMARRSSNGAASDCYRCRQRGWEGQRWQREIATIEAGSEGTSVARGPATGDQGTIYEVAPTEAEGFGRFGSIAADALRATVIVEVWRTKMEIVRRNVDQPRRNRCGSDVMPYELMVPNSMSAKAELQGRGIEEEAEADSSIKGYGREGSSSEALEMKRRRRWGVRQVVVAVVVTTGGEEEIRTTLMARL
ncbi:hypothetical protein BHE74_00018562 [Ensete ventricosum]|nr:hypothetical protein BHE74_00018562 [Ensete ventricosum]